MSYFDERELQEFGFRQLGRGVRLSRLPAGWQRSTC